MYVAKQKSSIPEYKSCYLKAESPFIDGLISGLESHGSSSSLISRCLTRR